MAKGFHYEPINDSKEKSHWKDERVKYPYKNIYLGNGLYIVRTINAQKYDAESLVYDHIAKEQKSPYEILNYLSKKNHSIQALKMLKGPKKDTLMYTPQIGSFWISNTADAYIISEDVEFARTIARVWNKKIRDLVHESDKQFKEIISILNK